MDVRSYTLSESFTDKVTARGEILEILCTLHYPLLHFLPLSLIPTPLPPSGVCVYACFYTCRWMINTRHLPQSCLHFSLRHWACPLVRGLASPPMGCKLVCSPISESQMCASLLAFVNMMMLRAQISMLVSQALYLKSHLQGYCYLVFRDSLFYISPLYIQKKLSSLLYFPLKFNAVSNGSRNKIAIIKQGMLWVLFVPLFCFYNARGQKLSCFGNKWFQIRCYLRKEGIYHI